MARSNAIESTVLTTFRDPGRERMVPPYRDVESLHKRGVAQPGSARALGARGRGFESRRPRTIASLSRLAGATRSVPLATIAAFAVLVQVGDE